MTTTLIEKLVGDLGDLGDKRRWRQYRARVRALPTTYRTTVKALERYLDRRARPSGGLPQRRLCRPVALAARHR